MDDNLDEAEVKRILREGLVGFNKEIAGLYVKPLLDEKILKVTKDHIQIMNLVVPRERVVFFHIALTQIRSPHEFFPIRQGRNGFTVEKAKAARGNTVVDAYRVTSNASDGTSILLTKKLAWELWEVVAFFIPVLDKPLDNPLPRTYPQGMDYEKETFDPDEDTWDSRGDWEDNENPYDQDESEFIEYDEDDDMDWEPADVDFETGRA
jgi:hypothetical protein